MNDLITAPDLLNRVQSPESSPFSDKFILHGIRGTRPMQERETMALALYGMLKYAPLDEDQRDRLRYFADHLAGDAAQACVTCGLVFFEYNDDGGCPRCGSQDCAVVDVVLPE